MGQKLSAVYTEAKGAYQGEGRNVVAKTAYLGDMRAIELQRSGKVG